MRRFSGAGITGALYVGGGINGLILLLLLRLFRFVLGDGTSMTIATNPAIISLNTVIANLSASFLAAVFIFVFIIVSFIITSTLKLLCLRTILLLFFYNYCRIIISNSATSTSSFPRLGCSI